MVKYKEMIAGQVLTATAASYYIAPANTQATIQAAVVSNGTAGVVVVDLHKVPAAGSPTSANKIATRTVPAGSTATLWDAINHKLEPGTQLYAVGLDCGLTVSGVEYIPE
ncbi:hypothetical protein D3C78_638760 [compost metagenome]